MAEVTYLTPSGALEIRHMSNQMADMCRNAQTLKARYFVATDGWDAANMCPIWSVFDMRRAQKDNPYPNAWGMGPAVREFRTETSDAAVMFALALQGKS